VGYRVTSSITAPVVHEDEAEDVLMGRARGHAAAERRGVAHEGGHLQLEVHQPARTERRRGTCPPLFIQTDNELPCLER
jgi:hypothetical protein